MDRLPSALLAVAVLALLDGLVSRVLAYLPVVLFAGGTTASSIGPILAVGSLLILLVSPVGTFLLGYYAAAALDVETALPGVVAFVFVVAYLGSVVGFVIGVGFAPPEVETAGSFLARLITGATRGLGETVVLTVAVVGGAALGRL